MISKSDAEILERLQYWLAIKDRLNINVPFVKGMLKGEARISIENGRHTDFLHGWNQAMSLVSMWINDIAIGKYNEDVDNMGIPFESLPKLKARWEKELKKDSWFKKMEKKIKKDMAKKQL